MYRPEPGVREHAPPGTERLLAGLTPEQAQAVTFGTGPLLLLAGPGAGKTRTLTHRAAYLLGEEVARGVTAATFHSVCARLLREHAGVFGRTERYTIYDEAEVRRVIDWLLSDAERGEIQQALADYGQPASAEALADAARPAIGEMRDDIAYGAQTCLRVGAGIGAEGVRVAPSGREQQSLARFELRPTPASSPLEVRRGGNKVRGRSRRTIPRIGLPFRRLGPPATAFLFAVKNRAGRARIEVLRPTGKPGHTSNQRSPNHPPGPLRDRLRSGRRPQSRQLAIGTGEAGGPRIEPVRASNVVEARS
jgi:hypothetical protein